MTAATSSRLLAEHDRRLAAVRWRVVLFVVVALATAVAGLGWIGISAGVYVPRTRLYFVADSGQDLRVGMAVKLSGFRIGTVEAVALDDSARVLVEMAIEDRYLKFIKKDSTVRLAKENLIGDSMIDVSRGSESKAQVKPEDRLGFEPGRNLEQIATDIRDRVLPVVDEVEKFLHYLNDPEGDIRRAVADLRTLSAELNGTRERIDTVLVRVEETVAAVGVTVEDSRGRVASILDRADKQMMTETVQLLRSLRQTTDEANKSIGTVSKDLPVIIGDLKAITGQVRQTVHHSAPAVPKLIDDGRDIAGGTRQMVDGLLNSWPFNDMTRPQGSGLTTFSSHD